MNKIQTSTIVEQKAYYHGKEAVLRKAAFASGEIVYNFPWMLVSAYLMFFLTDIALVPTLVVSALFLGVRIFDAVNDPLIGSLADGTKSKMGRYRPWMLAGSIILIPSVILLFWAHPTWSVTARVWYTCIVYIFAVIGATMWNIPFGGLNAVITPHSEERASFTSYRIFISALACAGSAGMFLPLVNQFSGPGGADPVRGYLMAAIVVCGIAAPFVLTSVLGTKEVIQPPPNQKIEFKVMIRNITKNPPLLIILVGFLVYGFMAYGRMTAAMYYYSYYWENPTLFAVYNLFNGILSGVAAFFGGHVISFLKSKRNAILFGYFFMVVVNGVLFFLTPANSTANMALTLMIVSGVFQGLVTCVIYSMVPDTVEYGQWKTGIRTDGFIYSATSFMLKFGGAMSPALLGTWLARAQYAPNAAQTQASLYTMNFMTNMMPTLLCVVGFIAFYFYKLDGQLHAQIVEELTERGDFGGQ